MDLRNCPRCGKMFNHMSNPVCAACEREEEEVFKKLKEYIAEYPMCSLRELSAGTEVSVKRIMAYVREGRLEVSKGMHGEFKCDGCGKPIMRGRYCDTCVIRLNQGVQELFSKDDDKNGPRMRTKIRKKL